MENKPYLLYVYIRHGPVDKVPTHPSPAPAMASRWSLRSVLTASRARHRSAGDMVIDALASALVTPWSGPSTWAAPAAASSRVSRSPRPGWQLARGPVLWRA